MSRLPQRWWTQRNAIRNANCKTSWIIKILNAHCAFRKCLRAYLSECLYTPLIPYDLYGDGLWPWWSYSICIIFAWMYMASHTLFGVWIFACSGEIYFMYVFVRDCGQWWLHIRIEYDCYPKFLVTYKIHRILTSTLVRVLYVLIQLDLRLSKNTPWI